jgi:hypothetical protein
MQILVFVIIIQFVIICWLAWPRIKQYMENNHWH